MEERLQKIIARAGVASRRRAEQLIVSGHVTVNGRVVTELGTRADAARDHIKVSGKLLQGAEEHVYIALHKPAEVVATLSDPEGRRSLGDLLSAVPVRVYPVGRLEYHASGLLFLTNDGELANKLIRTHGLRQTYLLKVKGNLSDSEIAKASAVSRARIERGQRGENPWYEVTMADASRDPLREQLGADGASRREDEADKNREPGDWRFGAGAIPEFDAEGSDRARGGGEESRDASAKCGEPATAAACAAATPECQPRPKSRMTPLPADAVPEWIRSVEPYVPGRPVRELESELGRRVLQLASNENPLGPSPRAIEAARRALAAGNRYSEGGEKYLREALAARHGVAFENVILGAGSSELIGFAARMLLGPGSAGVTSASTFPLYPISIRISGADLIEIPLARLRD